MKKNVPLAFMFLCTTLILKAQNPVPNPGFENWTAGNPDDWTAYNFGPGASPIMQTTPSYNGAFALRGEVITVGAVDFYPIVSSTDASAEGFPVSQQYASLDFYYKTNITGTSYFYTDVVIQDAFGVEIGRGSRLFAGVISSYTFTSIPIFYSAGTPAECVIGFTISDTIGIPASGNYFIVDEVSLSGGVNVNEPSSSPAIEKVHPNPASGYSSVYFSLPSAGDIKFELYDATGRKHKELFFINESAGRHKFEMDVSVISTGFYFLQLSTEAGRTVAPFQVAH